MGIYDNIPTYNQGASSGKSIYDNVPIYEPSSPSASGIQVEKQPDPWWKKIYDFIGRNWWEKPVQEIKGVLDQQNNTYQEPSKGTSFGPLYFPAPEEKESAIEPLKRLGSLALPALNLRYPLTTKAMELYEKYVGKPLSDFSRQQLEKAEEENNPFIREWMKQNAMQGQIGTKAAEFLLPLVIAPSEEIKTLGKIAQGAKGIQSELSALKAGTAFEDLGKGVNWDIGAGDKGTVARGLAPELAAESMPAGSKAAELLQNVEKFPLQKGPVQDIPASSMLPAPKEEYRKSFNDIKAALDKIIAGQKSAVADERMVLTKKSPITAKTTIPPTYEQTIPLPDPLKDLSDTLSSIEQRSVGKLDESQIKSLEDMLVSMEERLKTYTGKESIAPEPNVIKLSDAVKAAEERFAQRKALMGTRGPEFKAEPAPVKEVPVETPPAEPPKPPITKPMQGEIKYEPPAEPVKDPTWTEKLLRFFMTDKDYIAWKGGDPGKKLIDIIDNAQAEGDALKSQAVKELRTARKSLNKEEQASLVNWLDTGEASNNPRVKEAFPVFDKWRKYAAEQASGLGLQIKTEKGLKDWKGMENWFPHNFKKDFNRNTVEEILKKGGSKKDQLLAKLVEDNYGKDAMEAEIKLNNWIRESKGWDQERLSGKLGMAGGKPSKIGQDVNLSGQINPNLEISRSPNEPPGWDTSLGSFENTTSRILDRITEAKNFGKNDEILKAQINEIGKVAGSERAGYILDGIAKNLREKAGSDPLSPLRSFNVMTSMMFSTISNAGQKVNAIMAQGPKAAWFALKNSNKPEFKEFAEESGALAHNFQKEVMDLGEGGVAGGAKTMLKANGFDAIEGGNRKFSVTASLDYISQKMKILKETSPESKEFKNAMLDLKELGIDGEKALARGAVPEAERSAATQKILKQVDHLDNLTQDELYRAGWEASKDQQFIVQGLDLPRFMSGPLGKTAMQFKSFAYFQSRFMGRTIIKEAKKGNYAPLFHLFVTYPATMEVIADARSLITDRPRPNNAFDRYMEDFWNPGVVGIIQDTAASTELGKAGVLGSMAGVTASKAADLAVLGKTGFDIATGQKKLEDIKNKKNLLKPILSNLPGGQAVKLALFPTGDSPYWKRKEAQGWTSTRDDLVNLFYMIKGEKNPAEAERLTKRVDYISKQVKQIENKMKKESSGDKIKKYSKEIDDLYKQLRNLQEGRR